MYGVCIFRLVRWNVRKIGVRFLMELALECLGVGQDSDSNTQVCQVAGDKMRGIIKQKTFGTAARYHLNVVL